MNRRALLAGLLASLLIGLPEGAKAARKRKARKSRSGTSRRRSSGSGSSRRSGGGGASYYPNCAAARADGAAPVRRGDPGYSRKLDRDGDGVGCE